MIGGTRWFAGPYGAWHDNTPADERFRLALGDLIPRHHLERLRGAGVGRVDALLTA